MKKNKFSILIIISTFFCSALLSQRPLEVIINFFPPYPREFSAYFNDPQNYSITVINHTDVEQTVFFLGELKGTYNGVLIKTLDQFKSDIPVIIAANAVVNLSGDQIGNLYQDASFGDFIIEGIPPQDLNLNGMLPEGEYVWCINAYDYNSEFTPLSIGCSAPFSIYYGDQITFIAPYEEEVVENQVFPIQYNANISDPTKRAQLEYEIKMIDLTEYPDADLDLLFLDGSAQPVLEVENEEELYIYNDDGAAIELEEGHHYGIRIKAIDPFGEVQFANNGYSEIRTFWFGFNPNDVEEEQENVSDCYQNCNYTARIGENNAGDATSFAEWKIGYFTMEDIQANSTVSNEYEGTATIKIPWLDDLKVAVQFNNIKVNTQGRVWSGNAKGIDESNNAYDLGDIYNTLFVGTSECPSATIAAISDDISTARNVANLIAGQPSGLPLGINQTIQGRQFTLGIIDMNFEPDRANMAMLSVVDMQSLAEDLWISVAGNDMCLTPDGIGGEYILHQAFETQSIGFGNLVVKTYGGMGDEELIKQNYCFLEVNCDGIRTVALRGEVNFPRSTIVPDKNGNIGAGKAKAYFEMTLDFRDDPTTSPYAYNGEGDQQGTHLMLGLSMDPFQIKGLEGWTFAPDNGIMDMSDLENPDNIVFPPEYDLSSIGGGDVQLINTWRGFHFSNIQLFAPKQFSKGPRQGAFFSNVILDPDITMDAGIIGLLSVGDGNFEGWGFSIDTFKLHIVQNTFINGQMLGKVNPPITGDIDYIKYKAILDKNEDDDFRFYAVAMPDTLISVPISVAKAALCPNSYVTFTLDPDHSSISTFLKGQMVMDVIENLPAEIELPDVIPGFQIRLADFQLNYNSTQGFVTPDMVADGTGTAFGFGIEIQDATCGDLYSGPIFEFEGFEGYEYDVSDMHDLLTIGLPSEDYAMQENIDGFPISINDIEIGFSGKDISLDFDLDLNLSAEPLSIMMGTRLNLISRISTNAQGIDRFNIKRLKLECGRLGGSDPGSNIGIDPFMASGEICFIQNQDGSKGFTGDVNFGLGFFAMSLKAGFGSYGKPEDGRYGTNKYYGWWYFDGMARVSPGLPIPAFPPIAHFNGFGGGIYWNTTAPSINVSMDQISQMTGPTQPASTDVKPSPSFGSRTLAFRTSWNLIMDQIFMVDPFVAGTWNPVHGLQSLSFGGDFWSLATTYAARSNARIYGHSQNTLTFMDDGDNPKKVALLGTNNIKANIIDNVLYGAGLNNSLINTAFAIGHEDFFPTEPSNDDDDNIFWFFNAGNPYKNDMGGVVFDIPGFNLSKNKTNGNNLGIDASFKAMIYAMVGQNIPNYLPNPPGEVATLFGTKNSDEGSFSGGSKEDERNATTANSGEGIVFGSHVTASCEISAIFYASLKIFAGLDLMLVNMEGNSCFTSNGEVNDPGVNGWYGKGRAYAGIEGAVGVKGKIFGKEIDIKIIELVAAIMVEAGGPDPMWLDGRAVLAYNLLGGTIKGSTRMMISVGEKCEPPITSPFDFPIIAEYYPNEENNRKISPFVNPTVSFTVPINETLYIPDVDGKTQQIRPILVENDFKIIKDCSNCTTSERDTRYDLIAEDGRSASYDPVNPLTGMNSDTTKKQYKMQLKVSAEEYKNGTWKKVKINGENWEESIDLTFKTDKLPYPIPQERIGKTKPITNQKFYLSGEHVAKHYVHTRDDIAGTYYYPADNNGNSYEYFAVFKDAQGGEIHRQNITYDETEKKLKWNKPALENNTKYIVQVVRKSVSNNPISNQALIRKTLIDQNLLLANSSDSLDFQYKVEPELPELSPLTTVGSGEVLLYSFTFETSRYNTLNEKMANATVTVEEKNGYQRININDTEGFDTYDINGWEDDAEYSSPPRVMIADPFDSPFHNNLSKPKLGSFANTYMNSYKGEWTGVQSEPFDLDPNGNLDLGGGIIIGQTQGAGGNQSNGQGNNENNNSNQNNQTLDLDFPNYLPNTNFHWQDAEDLHQDLNEFVINATILKDGDEDDPFEPVNGIGYHEEDSHMDIATLQHHGPFSYLSIPSNPSSNDPFTNEEYAAGGSIDYTMGNHPLSLKYYVTEDILADAQAYADFGEEWVDITLTGDFSTGGGLNYSQTLSAQAAQALIDELEEVTNAIINSALINGPGANGFSNKVRFRANKSYEAGETDNGSSKTLQFSN